MFDKTINGWKIMVLSFKLLFKDFRLLLLSLIMVSIQLFAWNLIIKMDVQEDDYLIIFSIIFFNIFIMNLFQGMITYLVYNRMQDKNITLTSSFLMVVNRLSLIFKWSLLDSGVVFILFIIKKIFENSKLGFLLFFVDAIEVSWSLIKTLMLPIVMLENSREISDGLRRSTKLFKENWGENLVGTISFFLLGLIMFVFIFSISVTIARTNIDPMQGVYVFIYSVVILQAIMYTLKSIWHTVLYIYVTTNKTVPTFEDVNIKDVFKEKKMG